VTGFLKNRKKEEKRRKRLHNTVTCHTGFFLLIFWTFEKGLLGEKPLEFPLYRI
jgi:hypothetical protein